jgi:hypothetical protein
MLPNCGYKSISHIDPIYNIYETLLSCMENSQDTIPSIGKTLSYYWKLKAIESIGMSSDVKLPEEEIIQLINTLVDNCDLNHLPLIVQKN